MGNLKTIVSTRATGEMCHYRYQKGERVAVVDNCATVDSLSGGTWGTIKKQLPGGWFLVEAEGKLLTVPGSMLVRLKEITRVIAASAGRPA